jgi:hypothetical protein
MGVADRYQDSEDERWRSMPLRYRYRWRAIAVTLIVILFCAALYIRLA